MVRLVPPFLRSLINPSENSEPTSSAPPNKSDTSHENADVSDKFEVSSYSSDETLDTIKNEHLDGMKITSNIATIASIDWGPPKLNLGLLDGIGQSGKHLFDRIRGNKTTFENPEDLTKNIKNLPKVYESDFTVYLNQINEIYTEYANLNIFGGGVSESNEIEDLNVESTIDDVSREYFEDDYDVHGNSILNKDLDSIPESIEFLESQLMLINNQLRELVGTHLKHVSESFVCIEDLKNSFTDLHGQISNVRDIFDNLKGIYNSPVQYKHFKPIKTSQSIKENSSTTNEEHDKTLKSLESQTLNEDGSYTLHEVLMFKKKVIEFLGYLKVLRGVSCTPEYIQGIVEINNMALARIFAACSLEYFQTQLSKFVLANSVAVVVKDTIVNLERVAEAKFIDLSFFALTECYSLQESEEYEKSLKATLEKIEPVLVVLTISGLLGDILTTLESTKISPVDFTLKKKVSVDSFQEQLDLLLMGFKHSNIFLLHMFHSISCVYLFHVNDEYMPDSSRSSEMVEKMILKIQESFTNGINRDYQKITETTQLLKTELSLPPTCKSKQYFEFYEKVEVNKKENKGNNNNKENKKKKRKNTKKDDKGENGEQLEEEDNKQNKEKDEEKVAGDLSEYYEKLYLVVENAFVRSLEGLFASLDLDVKGDDLFSGIETTMMSMKMVEVMYKKLVERCVDHLGVTNRLAGEVLLTEFKNKSLETEKLKQLLSDKFFFDNRKRKENEEVVDELEDRELGETENIETEREYKELEDRELDRERRKVKSVSNMMEVFYKYASSEAKKNIEILFEQSLVKVHENLNQEKWEGFEKVELEGKQYNLVESAVKLNEHLNVYFGISEKFFFMANTTVSKSINLFAYFNTLIENELEKNLCVKKLCLIIQTLDFFSTLMPIKIRNVSTQSPETDGFNLDEENAKNYDLLVVLGSNAENCVLEAKLLRKKSADLLANFIFSQVKIHLINWVFKYTDLQEGTQVEDAIDDVNMVSKTISDLYFECSELFVLEDLKSTFSDSFDKLVDFFKKQNVNLSQNNTFSDDCTRIMTNLEHLKDIKLEIISFAHRLSN